ncbi:MAG: phospholipid carrier-dependent glycosyltransferase [Thermoguttaceae bacterium]
MKSRTTFFWLCAIFATAMLLRFGVACLWQVQTGGSLYFGDSDTYWQLARTIAHGEPYEYDGAAVFRAPAYPTILAPIWWLETSLTPATLVFIARLENVVIGALTTLAVAWLAFLVTRDKLTAIVAAGIVAVDPLHSALSVLVLTETPFSLVMVVSLAFVVASWQATTARRSFANAAAAGVAAGVAVLLRPSWLLFAVATPFYVMISSVFSHEGTKTRRGMYAAAIYTVLFTATMLPWTVRNFVVTGLFLPTTLQVGVSLYDGLNPNATGASDMRFVNEYAKSCGVRDEIATDRHFRDAAVAWAKENPQRAIELAGVKLVRLWNPVPNEPSWRRFPLNTIIPLFTIPVLIAAAAGFWLRRGDVTTWILVAPAVYLTLLHIVFVASIRYRSPAMLTLTILAAVCCVYASRILKTI